MAHNKSYRSFIILQEDEKGHSMASDKPLTGYAKIETRNDKCKVSFYAQNLKKDYKECCMILVCDKKDFKKNINLGPMNISPQGKAEMNIEYDSINIGDLNISYDKIVGAAVGKEINGRIVFFMCGFLNNQMPKDNWKNYDLKKVVGGEVKEKVNKEYKYKNDKEYKKEEKKEHKKYDYKKSEDNKKEDYSKNKEYNDDEKHSCEDIIEEKPKNEKVMEEKKENIKTYSKEKECYEKDDDEYYMKEKKGYSKKEDIKRDFDYIGKLERGSDSYQGEEYELENRFDKYEEDIESVKYREKVNVQEESYEVDFDSPIGEIIVGALEGCEKVTGFAKDIKRCAWYKVDVDSFDAMCNMSNYNKYTMMYYPMINYYPYINKKGHFFFGIKCDKDGEIKYILYAIPGTKSKKDQPYGGRTGFVTWDEHGEEGNGYWIMFYDFENSCVVIPMK